MSSIIADGPTRLAATEAYQARRREVQRAVEARYAARLAKAGLLGRLFIVYLRHREFQQVAQGHTFASELLVWRVHKPTQRTERRWLKQCVLQGTTGSRCRLLFARRTRQNSVRQIEGKWANWNRMKGLRLTVLTAMLLTSGDAFAQGQFVFNNYVPPEINARFITIYDPRDGSASLIRPGWQMQLLGGPPGGQVGT
jgi:hypothetical protein